MNSLLRRTLCGFAAMGAIQAAQAGTPRYDHVVIVVMENHGLEQVVGRSAAPYITSLSVQGANFTNSHGVTHPSQPNYIALFSGGTQGTTSNTCAQKYTGVNNLGAQLFAAGLSFKGYAESMPSNGYLGCNSGPYARKHNPWVNFPNVPASSNLTFSSFPTDFTKLPTVSMIVPNLINDMHDASVNTGDVWLKKNLDAYAQWAKKNNSLLIVTFDEDEGSDSANLIPTIFVGARVMPGNYNERINHYNVLSTIQSFYGLAPLSTAKPVTSVFDDNGLPNCNATVVNGGQVSCEAAGMPGATGVAFRHVYSTNTAGGQCTRVTAPGFDTSGCSTATPIGSFTPILGTTSVRVVKGGSGGTVGLTLESHGGYEGTVTVTLSGNTPAGITMETVNVFVPVRQTVQATLRLRAAAGMPDGEYQVSVKYDSGTLHKNWPLEVRVRTQ